MANRSCRSLTILDDNLGTFTHMMAPMVCQKQAIGLAEIGRVAMSWIRRLIPYDSATVKMFDFKANEAVVVAGEGDKLGQPLDSMRTRLTQSGHPKGRLNRLKQGHIILLGEAELAQNL